MQLRLSLEHVHNAGQCPISSPSLRPRAALHSGPRPRIVQNKVSKLCNRMQDLLTLSLLVDIYHAVRCISLDVITEYAFDNCRNLLDTPGFADAALDGAKKGQPLLWQLQ